MKKPILTIIIPSYNVKEYLNDCLDSLITVKDQEKLEIIVVDDGSKDTTANIAHEYMSNYPNLVSLIQKENGGHGSTINVGVKQAKGKYFKVLDADDKILNLDAFLEKLETLDVDAIISSYQSINIKSQEIIEYNVNSIHNNTIITLEELLRDYKNIGHLCSFHGLTFLTKKYKEHDITLSEKIFYEDTELACFPFSYIQFIYILPIKLYNYSIGNDNQSVAMHNQVAKLGDIEKVIISILRFKEAHTLTLTANVYFNLILQRIFMVYFATALVKNPQKKVGRQRAEHFTKSINITSLEAYNSIKRSVSIYKVFNYLHISPNLLTGNKILKKIKAKLVK